MFDHNHYYINISNCDRFIIFFIPSFIFKYLSCFNPRIKRIFRIIEKAKYKLKSEANIVSIIKKLRAIKLLLNQF